MTVPTKKSSNRNLGEIVIHISSIAMMLIMFPHAMAGLDVTKELAFYGAYHQHPINQLIHFFFVVPCMFATCMLGPSGFLAYTLLRNIVLPEKASSSGGSSSQEKVKITLALEDDSEFSFELDRPTMDSLIKPLVSKTLRSCRRALKDAGVTSEMHIYPEGGHGYALAIGRAYLQTWTDRLFDWLNAL